MKATPFSTAPRADYRKVDFFPTHPGWTQALLNVVKFDGVISEPCAGKGHMVEVLERNGYQVEASDLTDYGCGYPVKDCFSIDGYENVVTNPPFTHAERMVEHWLKTTRKKVAVLVRLFWLESAHRLTLFQNYQPLHVIVVPERMPIPGFVNKHGKQLTCQFPHCWIVWDNSVKADKTELLWSSSRNPTLT